MKAIIRGGAGLFGLLLVVSAAPAQYFVTPVARLPYPPAPDTFGPGFYCVGPCGMTYGPNYCLYPPFPPYNGARPGAGPKGYGPSPGPGPGGMPAGMDFPNPGPPNKVVFPTHPFARGPRDFFMWNEALEEQEGRTARPAVVP